ncbi:MAG TPA: bifunctional diguanylate cyclase/phosphodiesterase, partial [Terracidiphilus sp.]|nr:bifunctional diguanylate cyclase/phosphodiesterase [Terracidiphilus sp.]
SLLVADIEKMPGKQRRMMAHERMQTHLTDIRENGNIRWIDPRDIHFANEHCIPACDLSMLMDRDPDFQDPLTGLPNRRAIERCLERLITSAIHCPRNMAVLLIDLDRFEMVNDSIGREKGDSVLAVMAARLHGCLRKGDKLARLAGGQFVIVMLDAAENEDVAQFARKLLASISRPIELDGNEMQLSARIGISQYPLNGRAADELLRFADTAVHATRHRGLDSYQFFSPTITEAMRRKQKLECDLYHAVTRDEFLLYYQPLISTFTGRITGMEALLRWRHPEHGMMSPAHFIPELEEMGLIVEVGQWALKTACRQAAAWQQLSIPPIRMAVNVSLQQFHNARIVSAVDTALTESGLAPQWLELELTESQALDSSEATISIMQDLKQLGISLALDDFGTGWSSLSYLSRLPFDRIKIDQSFVHDVGSTSVANSMVKNILSLSHDLKMACIAEGVETKQQRDYLTKLGCPELQGFLFCAPMAASECTALLRSADRSTAAMNTPDPSLIAATR